MRNRQLYPAILAFVAAPALLAAEAPTAFIGAEGFGAVSVGGRGGDVYHVTNLNNSGAGSLRYGIDNAPSGGRTIVFDVGGWIDLDSKLGITKNRITLAGQTAPGGIGVRGDQFSIGGDDIVIRHMRFRPGKGAGRVDGAGANSNAERIIYDHVSVGFSYDESFSTQANDLTLQYSSVSFGMEDHSAGSLIEGAGNLSFHHNVYAHNDTRNPKARAEVIDWRDNVVYNYHNGFIAGDSLTTDYYWRANFDGNTYIARQSTNRPMITGGRDWNYGLYFGENGFDPDGDGNADDVQVIDRATAMGSQSIVSSSYTWETSPFPASEVWQNQDAAAAYEWTLDHFGATPWDRDAVDARTASDVRNRTGARVSHENQLGIENDGYPTLGGLVAPLDYDRDGMPDAWEVAHGLDHRVANNNSDFDNDGYTDLEEYLTDIAAFPAPGVIGATGTGTRYAEAQSWSHDWQPSPLDTASIGSGRLIVDAVGQHAGTLRVAPDAGTRAILLITSGWLRIENELAIGPGGSGTVQLGGGALYASQITLGAGDRFVMTGGALYIDTFDGDFVQDGGTTYVGGSAGTLHVTGDYTVNDGVLEIEIGSPGGTPGVGYDRVEVGGALTIGGGTLDLPWLPGYAPKAGDVFEVFSAADITGGFGSVNAYGLSVALAVVDGATEDLLVLTVLGTEVAGDTDFDSDVDNADLQRAIANFTGPGGVGKTLATGDTDGDADVDNTDLQAAIAGFTGPLANATVPEPASLGLLAFGGLALMRRRRGQS